jgi:hypothetical protein
MTDASPEAFAAVADLIAIVADPKACAKRLADLRAQIDAATAAQAKLDADRLEHDRKVAADTAALAKREAALRMHQAELMGREAAMAETARIRGLPESFPLDPNLGPGTRSHSGLVRE